MLLYLLHAWPFAIFGFIILTIVGVIPSIILWYLGFHRFAKKWVGLHSMLFSNYALFLAGVRVKVTGSIDQMKSLVKDRKEICFISNHTSMLDIPLIYGPLGLSCGFIAKKELVFTPFINLLCLAQRCVLINRTSLKKSVSAIRRGVKQIKEGFPMLVFPEGTRSKDGKIAPFKHGSFRLATESNAVIIPITIKGVRDAFEDRKHFFKKTECLIHVGQPVPTAGLTDRQQIIEMESNIENSIREVYECTKEF